MNHMFWKWHLGYCLDRYTPAGRSFDTLEGRYLAVGKDKTKGKGTHFLKKKKKVNVTKRKKMEHNKKKKDISKIIKHNQNRK